MKDYAAQVDWPGGRFWPELAAANSDALVILSVHDPDEWFTSRSNTIYGDLKLMTEQGDSG